MLNRFFENVFGESEMYAGKPNSFELASQQQLAAHLKIDTYDSFQLTDAVRPALDLKIKPIQTPLQKYKPLQIERLRI